MCIAGLTNLFSSLKEIIENSISQLGLDDDSDDDVHPAPKVEDDGGWSVSSRSDNFNDSSILMQDLVSCEVDFVRNLVKCVLYTRL